MAKLALETIHRTFKMVSGPDDVLDPTITVYDHRLVKGTEEIVKAVARVHFRVGTSNVLVITIYENNSYRIMSSACGHSREAIKAYARAEAFLKKMAMDEIE